MPNLKKCIFSSISSLPSQLLPWFHLIAKRFISNEIFCQKLWKAFQIVQLVFNHHSWTKKLNKHPAELAHVPISLKQVSPKGSPITQLCKLVSQKFYSMAIRGLSKWSHEITFGNELFCELKFGKWGAEVWLFWLGSVKPDNMWLDFGVGQIAPATIHYRGIFTQNAFFTSQHTLMR